MPRYLVGDPLRLGQVLINLANNAVKFTESGEIVVSIEKVERKEDQVRLKFIVSDTGIGLTEEQMNKLFQSFSQADTSTTRKYGGTRLGLAISKKLVHMMDGEIRVESQYGQGTSFIFTANFGLGKEKAEDSGLDGFLVKPVNASVLFDAIMQAFGEEIPETSRLTRRQKEADALQVIRGARILLVEDNEINQQVAREILEGAGLIVTIANNGQEAVDAVKETNYDVVLMDVQMPVMDGYRATRAIRKWESVSANADSDIWETEARGRRTEARGQMTEGRSQMTEVHIQASNLQPPTSNIPIIAMTAHAMAGDEEKSLEAGMNGHVTKPIDPDQLFAALQKWIRPRERRAADRQQGVTTEPSAPTPPKLSEDDLPESLAGFDLEAGLRRLMGNKRLYRKLLIDFGSKYTGIAGEIRHALDTGDFEKTHSLVHDLKGLAGNLAATELQAATVEMEKLIKGGQKKISTPEQLDQKFVELEKAIFRALQAVQILGSPAEDTPAAPSSVKLSGVPAELIKELFSRIQEAAEMGDFKQISSIAGELKSRSKAMVPICDRLVQLAEDFDFDGILKMVAELENNK